jgi:hypothetical protein
VYSIQHYATGRWFSWVSSINKIDHHNITEILLKVALNTNKQTNRLFYHTFFGHGNGSVVVIRLSRQWFPCNNMSYTVKPADAITSIKQLPFTCPVMENFHMNLTSFNRSPLLKDHSFFVPHVASVVLLLLQTW